MKLVSHDRTSGYNWSARNRTSASDSLRYSRFVALMKRILSLGAFLIIAAVLAFFFVERQPRRLELAYERLGRIQNDLTMVKPRLTGSDSQGNPFVITADTGVQDAHNPKRAKLHDLEADLNLAHRHWLNARAKAGLVDLNSGTLQLDGGIDVFTDSGYMLHTQSASVNLKLSVISGNQSVNGQGPAGTIRADAFHMDRKSNFLTLLGHVHTTILETHK